MTDPLSLANRCRDRADQATGRELIGMVRELADALACSNAGGLSLLYDIRRELGLNDKVGLSTLSTVARDLRRNLRHWRDECGKVHARIKELEAALEPFAAFPVGVSATDNAAAAYGVFHSNDKPLLVSNFRRARAALATDTRKEVMPNERSSQSLQRSTDVAQPAQADELGRASPDPADRTDGTHWDQNTQSWQWDEGVAPELLTCPFCGKPARLRQTTPRREWWVQCTAPYLCMGRAWSTLGEGFQLPQDAIDAWNRRAPPAPAVRAAIREECELAALRAVECAPHKNASLGEGRKQLERRAYIDGARAAAQNVAALSTYDGLGPAGAVPEHAWPSQVRDGDA